ncbi:MAG: hypothetical protein IKP32_04035 [Clostridia bacterium]|nr:hypothetical protein [Clostridia bacterium]
MSSAIEKLRQLGFDVDDQILLEIKNQTTAFMSETAANPSIPDQIKQMFQSKYESDNQTMFDILLNLGMGDYDYDTGEWTPKSSQVYAFDAEVFDIARMYTLFLQGVQSIVPDVVISDIQEDLSQLTDEMIPSETWEWMQTDGKRSVSFVCNNHPYSIELESWGDWINMNILDFMNEVLEKEGCPNRLYVISHELDQIVMMIYSTQERADMIKALINVH